MEDLSYGVVVHEGAKIAMIARNLIAVRTSIAILVAEEPSLRVSVSGGDNEIS